MAFDVMTQRRGGLLLFDPDIGLTIATLSVPDVKLLLTLGKLGVITRARLLEVLKPLPKDSAAFPQTLAKLQQANLLEVVTKGTHPGQQQVKLSTFGQQVVTWLTSEWQGWADYSRLNRV